MRLPNFLRTLPQACRQSPIKAVLIGAVLLYMLSGLVRGRGTPPPPAPTASKTPLAQVATSEHSLQGEVDAMRRAVKQQADDNAKVLHTLEAMTRTTQEVQQSRDRDKQHFEGLLQRQQQQFDQTLIREREQRPRQGTAAPPAPRPIPVVQRAAMPPPTSAPDMHSLFEIRQLRPEKRSPRPRPPGPDHDDTAYLPATSMAPARLITGLVASSRGHGNAPGAEGDGPVMLMLTGPYLPPDMLQGPERGTVKTAVDLRGCRLFGWGRADLASGRVYVTVHLQACVLPDKSTYETPVRGYIVDSDNTNGVVGRLETRNSAMVAKAAVAGVVQEAATLFSLAKSQLVVTNTAGGYVQPFTGVQNSIQQISAYYLEQARLLAPVLWIEADQPVRVVLQDGLHLEGYPVVALVGER
jgi:conjugal transfer pilus assembly protein TraB